VQLCYDAMLRGLSSRFGVDVSSCVSNKERISRKKREARAARELDVRYTPTLVVGIMERRRLVGWPMVGIPDSAELVEVIKRAGDMREEDQ
jgi:hypothetical protein